eukprot:TRINITY_DN41373_c0_g1_i1.p1 TRINITY_DN41373_c0_g1~~TRINITY_DN41373_c0_g1_i1.p1  ORF type:complete len:362 (+),score=58.51 TRINITY_DN41373_c0_g1_i1:176-1261(+)
MQEPVPGILGVESSASRLPLGLLAFWDRCQCKPCCQENSNAAIDGLDAISAVATYPDEEYGNGGFDTAAQGLASTYKHKLVERPEVEIEVGVKYKGQWAGHLFHGRGTLTRADGSSYEGNFVAGRAHGEGKFHVNNGDVYEGQWDRDKTHGFGRYSHSDGSVYEGRWVEDEKCGEGSERYVDESVYKGLFLHGRKHGYGEYRGADGTLLFEGQMQYDKMHGDGTSNFSDGRTYCGQWVNGHMNGRGTLNWPDGSVYVGGMKEDRRHGEGTLTWPDGRKYIGQWLEGNQDGEGLVLDAKGTELTGIWAGGQLVKITSEGQTAGNGSTIAASAAADLPASGASAVGTTAEAPIDSPGVDKTTV